MPQSVIDLTISHDDYEKIKVLLKSYRDKAGMRYLFGSATETDTIMHHEWSGPEDKLIIDFSRDKSKDTTDHPFIIDAHIIYSFTKQSTIAGLVYVMFLKINPSATIQEEKSSLQIEDNREQLKQNFLSSLYGNYSKTFIEGTLRCIDTGILTHIATLHPIPFSNVSRFETKGVIE